MPATIVEGGPAGPAEAAGLYRNRILTDRVTWWRALGGRQGLLRGGVASTVAGQMALSYSAFLAAVAERDSLGVALNRGYTVYADSATTVTFGAASASTRNDAVVVAFCDLAAGAGAFGTETTQVGGQLVVVPGVSGTTTPRTDSQIQTAVGSGGWFRVDDVTILATDTEINPVNVARRLDARASSQVQFVGRAEKTTDTAGIGASKVNLLSVTIPFPVNGARYRVHAQCCMHSDTAGGFTEVFLQHGVGAVTGGTVFGNSLIDHRVASRRETAHVDGDFVYGGASGEANYNVVLVATAGGGTSTDRGATTPTRMWVERIE